MDFDRKLIAELEASLPARTRDRLAQVADRIVVAKRGGGKIAVVTGSGPNLHEGVTTQIAALMHAGVIDGVTTSSAVVAHEMAGTLDRVKRVDGKSIGVREALLPRGGLFELTEQSDEQLDVLRLEMELDQPLIDRLRAAPGETIIKAAGNMAYPMGLRTERIAREVGQVARAEGRVFEEIAGRGADTRTMIGAGYRLGLPVLVSIPQLVGGGGVGLALADSISVTDRSAQIAKLLGEADVIIESAVALTQEIHDGPFETYTGHGIWAAWEGAPTYSLEDKTLVRFDLDPNLEKVWEIERNASSVQQAIDRGLPKTKMFDVPFRMEMSGFARLPGSLPVIGDIGVLWPILTARVAEQLDLEMDFISYPQQSEAGQAMREEIVQNVEILDRKKTLLNDPEDNAL